jgi:hypothetical protein
MSEQLVRCGAVKHGGVTLHCTLPEKHEGWHKGDLTDHREIVYDGSHHVIHTVETVTWEPVDHIHEAVRHMLAGRPSGDREPRTDGEAGA